jgi:hypothetical protein
VCRWSIINLKAEVISNLQEGTAKEGSERENFLGEALHEYTGIFVNAGGYS